MYEHRHPKTFSHIDFSNKTEKLNTLIASKGIEDNNVWLVDELIATTLSDKKNIEIIHFSKIGVKSMDDILKYANTNIGIFNCHYLKGLAIENIEIEQHDDICVVYSRN